MTTPLDTQQALAYYRGQYDEIGSRLLRLQQELIQARRDASRNRAIALIVQSLYESSQATPGASLGEILNSLLAESLRVECVAILRWRPAADHFVLCHGLGLDADFSLPALPACASSQNVQEVPNAARAALRAVGLRNWLWVTVPQDSNHALLLANRQPHPLDPHTDEFTEDDVLIAMTALKIYLGLRTQQRTLRALQAAEANYRTLFDSAHDALLVFDTGGQLLDANQQTVDLLGCPPAELRQQSLNSWLIDFKPVVWKWRWRRALAGRAQRIECPLRTASGRRLWTEIQLKRISAGTRQLLLAVVRDISERRQHEEALHYHAFHDPLTGLPNRAAILERLAQALHRCQQQPDEHFALLFLDLDRFKVINDSLGHNVGDRLLVAIGRRLRACLRQKDTIARIGGDEFVILLARMAQIDKARACAERLLYALARPFNLDDHEIYINASVGIVIADDRYQEPELLLRDADIAMYQAKSGSVHNRCAAFDPSMHERIVQLMHLEHDLRRALPRQEFLLHYQPIVELVSGRLKGFEALLRWRHPTRGMVAPGDFIPIAEETLLILPIGRYVLESACQQVRHWMRHHAQPPVVNVNLSGRQFTATNLAEEISSLAQRQACDPALLNLEITESAILGDITAAQETLQRLHEQGFPLSMDDFGTGYSALSYLHQFPFDTLKIDRSFVQAMESDASHTQIVAAIIGLAHTLGKTVVAEGVETAEQLAALRALGCDFGQGYYFSRPVDAAAADALLRDPPWQQMPD